MKVDMKTQIRILQCMVLFFTLTSCTTDKQPYSKPNIILIMSDDMGYSDIGPFGGEVRNPSLDSLAKSGMIFTDFHTSVACSPTR